MTRAQFSKIFFRGAVPVSCFLNSCLDGYLRRIEFVAKWRTKECSELFPANKRQSYGDLKRVKRFFGKFSEESENNELAVHYIDSNTPSFLFCKKKIALTRKVESMLVCQSV